MTNNDWPAVRRVVDDLVNRPGWSQAELSRRSGVDADTIGSLLKGERQPRPSTLRRLSLGGWGDETLLSRVLDRSTPASEAIEQQDGVDYRSGTGTLPDDPRAELDRVDADAQRMVHDVLRNADFDVSIAANHLPHNLYVNIDGRDVLVDVRVAVPHAEQDQLSLVGLAYESEDPLVFVALIDWPDELVERVEKAGAIYATPADVVAKLSSIGEE